MQPGVHLSLDYFEVTFLLSSDEKKLILFEENTIRKLYVLSKWVRNANYNGVWNDSNFALSTLVLLIKQR